MASTVLFTRFGNWFRGKCTKINRAIAGTATRFVCSRCGGIMEETVDSIKKLYDEVETVNGFCYL